VTKATRGLVRIEEPLEILVEFDTQIGVFVAGLAHIEKNNSEQILRGLVFVRRVECAINLLLGRLYTLLLRYPPP
jgi:hypothetical protein